MIGPAGFMAAPSASTEGTIAELAQREAELLNLIEKTPKGPRQRLLRHELRDVVSKKMFAERRRS